MDRGLGEQPFVSTASIWLICLMLEKRKWHGFKNKTLYRQLLEVFFGALLRFRYHLYRSNHRIGVETSYAKIEMDDGCRLGWPLKNLYASRKELQKELEKNKKGSNNND